MHWPTGVLYGLPSKNSILTTVRSRITGFAAQRLDEQVPPTLFVIGH